MLPMMVQGCDGVSCDFSERVPERSGADLGRFSGSGDGADMCDLAAAWADRRVIWAEPRKLERRWLEDGLGDSEAGWRSGAVLMRAPPADVRPGPVSGGVVVDRSGGHLTWVPSSSVERRSGDVTLRHVDAAEIGVGQIGVDETGPPPSQQVTGERQQPDISSIAVHRSLGEVRDAETAEISIQAALTGHLVFSTLHTNNAAGAIPRLLHLKVNPRLIAPAINAIIAQRLVRRLCDHCKEEYVPAQETIEKIKKVLSEIPKNNAIEIPKEIKTLYRSKGCLKCNFIGYSGRIGIFELFTITPNIEKIILGNTSSSRIMEVAKENGMITMKEDGILKALNGETSLEEVRRATGEIFKKERFIK